MPGDAYDPAAGPRIVPKPAAGAGPQPVGSRWLTLLASAREPAEGQYVTLTAETNMDVAAGPYWISVFDQTDQVYLALCGAGTICHVSVTRHTAGTHDYVGLVSAKPDTTLSPSDVQGAAGTFVTWKQPSPRPFS
ncbi:hypothetical protein [Streptomyces sp. HUAS TT7]|uniref:hypothetical protein n=1 Tax=Streptomyces sp. HUAS TT7 TaxID=3447507 RepID=UPI003F654C08